VPPCIEPGAHPAQIARNSISKERRSKAMASKNLGAVIQRAISDGAFRRQLQSDPAAALRGFNLTADEVAAIRSGDSSKLMSLGVDQRMSKVFSVGGGMVSGAQRASISDLNTGGSASAVSTDANAGTREGIVGDPTSGSREAVTTGNLSGTRAVNDSAPFDGGRASLADPTVSGTRAIHDSGPTDLRSAASTGDFSGTRAVNDSEPFAGNAAINDNIAAANAGRGGSLTGDMSVASHMADAGTADAVRAIHDVAPFEGNVNAAATSGGEFLGGDARLDPGIDSSHGFVPSDSADVQREMLDPGDDHGNALGNVGGGHPS
jgi:hypothetical protein